MEIPVNNPLITEQDVDFVTSTLRQGWVSGDSPVVAEFEAKFAQLCNRKHAVAVTNGTAALELVIHSLGIGPGDEVIVPSFAIVSCIGQILRAGAIPVFVDSDPLTWNLDVSLVEHKISSRTKAIVVVHTYGLPVDMDPVLALASKHGILIIEDAAESHGLKYKGDICGSFGIASTFSFYANKHITTGEGGMIVTDDDQLVASLRRYRNLAFQPHQRFIHEELGWNLRLSSIQCALGLSQLARLDETIAIRRRIGRHYQSALSDVADVQLPCPHTPYAENDYWVFGIVLQGPRAGSAGEIQKKLNVEGIGTRPFFWPLHRQPVLMKFGLQDQHELPVAEHLGTSGFYIPNWLGLTDEQIEYVVQKISKVLS